tara:strand:- start:368 stop:736 length:369 start_codon:yes stop_codon:yes gene_type:complete
MLKETKYYTPSIEELYVGLECFYNGKPHKIIDYNNLSKDSLKHITLKYFNQEDIESEGFTFKKRQALNPVLYFEKERFLLIFNSRTSTTELYHKEHFFSVLFRGTVKNKSEFKKLLKQLNIN